MLRTMTSQRRRSVCSARLCYCAATAAFFAATSQVVAQNSTGPFTEPQDMRWSVPLQGQTVTAPAGQLAPNPVQAPAPVIYNVQGATVSTPNSQPLRLNQNLTETKNDLAPALTPPSAATSTSPGPNSVAAPLYTTPNNQTFNNDGNIVAKTPGIAPVGPSTNPTTVMPGVPAASMPAVKAATPSATINLKDFGVTQQDVVKVRTAGTSVISLPTSTDWGNATGKPLKFVEIPNLKTASAANTAAYLPRRTAQAYVPATDGAAVFGQYLGIFLLGVAEGYASSGGGFSGGYTGGRGYSGHACTSTRRVGPTSYVCN